MEMQERLIPLLPDVLGQSHQFFGATNRTRTTPRTTPFSLANAYNRHTTIQPLISKFEKIVTPQAL
jgi:hypothetical protein